MVFTSKYPPIDIPTVGVAELLFENRHKIPDSKPILLDAHSDRRITYGQLKHKVLQFAAGLQDKCGFQKGDVLAVFAPNSIDYPVALLGAVAAGGIASPANPAYTVKELSHQVSLSEAKVIICAPTNVDIALETAAKCGLPLSHLFVFGEEAIQGVQPCTKALMSGRHLAAPVPITRPSEQASYMCFSSGTTGLSKGVISTHTNITSNLLQVEAMLGQYVNSNQDRVLGVLPFFHIFGLTVVVHFSLYLGVPLTVMTKFDLPLFLNVIQTHQISLSCLVPPIMVLLAKHPMVEKYNISSLRTIISGAAPLSAELSRDVQARLTGCKIVQGYGLTETSPVVTFGNLSCPVEGSCGMLAPSMSIKIINEEGQEVGVNQRGELWCKGPNIMAGYVKNPAATADCIDDEGYFHTGDVCVVDDMGNFAIVDRIKELIKYKGFQVPPAELESIILTHPSVADCAVIGVYDPAQATELPRAYVVLQSSASPSLDVAQGIMDHVASKVVQYKKLRGGVHFIDTVPKSPSGKLLRRVIKDWVIEKEKAVKIGAKL